MPFQLNPSKVPIWQNEASLRLGLGDDSQVLSEVTNAQERLIDLLFRGIPEGQLERVGLSVGLNEIDTKQLIEQLRPSLLDQSSTGGSGKALDVRFAEIIRIGFETSNAPERVLAMRASTVIEVGELNRTGLLLIKALSESGFCRFETRDYGSVRRQDIGELSYPLEQLGISRLAAARALLETNAPRLNITHPSKVSKKANRVIVMSAMHRVTPNAYRALLEPNLSIEYGIEKVSVSPLVVPGETPCLGCRDLWESEKCADWASTAIQLAARRDHLDDGAGLLFAVSMATKSICQFVDSGFLPVTQGFEISLRNRIVSELGWQRHPACECLLAKQKPNR
ncbi:MAG: hypothetical protein RL166_42 [Actinomycetota bacterium]